MTPLTINWHNGRVGQIIYRPNLTLDGEPVYGYLSDNRIDIYINTDFSLAFQASTLLHEILHKCLYPLRPVNHDENLDEVVVTTLETNLVPVWRSNPDTLAWIHEHLCQK